MMAGVLALASQEPKVDVIPVDMKQSPRKTEGKPMLDTLIECSRLLFRCGILTRIQWVPVAHSWHVLALGTVVVEYFPVPQSRHEEASILYLPAMLATQAVSPTPTESSWVRQ